MYAFSSTSLTAVDSVKQDTTGGWMSFRFSNPTLLQRVQLLMTVMGNRNMKACISFDTLYPCTLEWNFGNTNPNFFKTSYKSFNNVNLSAGEHTLYVKPSSKLLTFQVIGALNVVFTSASLMSSAHMIAPFVYNSSANFASVPTSVFPECSGAAVLEFNTPTTMVNAQLMALTSTLGNMVAGVFYVSIDDPFTNCSDPSNLLSIEFTEDQRFTWNLVGKRYNISAGHHVVYIKEADPTGIGIRSVAVSAPAAFFSTDCGPSRYRNIDGECACSDGFTGKLCAVPITSSTISTTATTTSMTSRTTTETTTLTITSISTTSIQLSSSTYTTGRPAETTTQLFSLPNSTQTSMQSAAAPTKDLTHPASFTLTSSTVPIKVSTQDPADSQYNRLILNPTTPPLTQQRSSDESTSGSGSGIPLSLVIVCVILGVIMLFIVVAVRSRRQEKRKIGRVAVPKKSASMIINHSFTLPNSASNTFGQLPPESFCKETTFAKFTKLAIFPTENTTNGGKQTRSDGSENLYTRGQNTEYYEEFNRFGSRSIEVSSNNDISYASTHKLDAGSNPACHGNFYEGYLETEPGGGQSESKSKTATATFYSAKQDDEGEKESHYDNFHNNGMIFEAGPREDKSDGDTSQHRDTDIHVDAVASNGTMQGMIQTNTEYDTTPDDEQSENVVYASVGEQQNEVVYDGEKPQLSSNFTAVDAAKTQIGAEGNNFDTASAPMEPTYGFAEPATQPPEDSALYAEPCPDHVRQESTRSQLPASTAYAQVKLTSHGSENMSTTTHTANVEYNSFGESTSSFYTMATTESLYDQPLANDIPEGTMTTPITSVYEQPVPQRSAPGFENAYATYDDPVRIGLARQKTESNALPQHGVYEDPVTITPGPSETEKDEFDDWAYAEPRALGMATEKDQFSDRMYTDPQAFGFPHADECAYETPVAWMEEKNTYGGSDDVACESST